MTSSGETGVLTTDTKLIVQFWDDWLARATSISAEDARGRPLAELAPALQDGALLERFRETLSSGTVQVISPALHGPVFPCAPRIASAHFQSMQQRVAVGPLLDGERIAGLVITVQDVTPQLDAERSLAAALSGDDAEARRAAAEAIAASPRIESLENFSPALRSDNWRVRRAAVTAIAASADPDLLRLLLTTLQREHRNFSTLSSALKLLAVTDADLTLPLAELMESEDVDLRIQAALALGEQHHPAAVAPLLRALEDPDPNVRFHAIEGLGRLGADAAVEPLLAIAESGDFFLGFAALDALGLSRDARVAPRLVPLLAEEAFRAPAAHALGQLGDEQVVAPLVETLNEFPDAAVAVVGALGSIADRLAAQGLDISAPARDALSPTGYRHVLAAVDVAPREALPLIARVLGWIGGDEAVAALGRLTADEGARDAAFEALVAQSERAVEALIATLDADDPDARIAAIAALGRLGSRRATEPLAALLGDPRTCIVASGALGRIGDPAAYEPLLALLGHRDLAVRVAAIGALNAIGHPDMPATVTRLLEHEDPLLRESAVRIAGYFGYGNALELVLARAADPEEFVRVAALEHLPFFGDGRAGPVLASALANDAPKVRAAAARALARLDTDDAAPLLVDALGDADQWVRYFAARSLGERRASAGAEALGRIAERDPAVPVRIAAIEALGTHGAVEGLEPLLRSAADRNPDVATAALRALGRVGGFEAARVLREAARHPEADWRKAAARGLAAFGTEAAVGELEWLAAADPDAGVVDSGISGLAEIAARQGAAGEAAVDSLVGLFADPEKCERAAAAVARLPVAAVSRVANGLKHPQPTVRRRTVDALARYRRPEATRQLQTAFTDEDPRVREAAAVGVTRLGTRLFDETLKQIAQNDSSRSVRRAAAAALASQRAVN